MQTIIDFIDRYAIDPHIYVVASTRSGHQRFELFWDREATEHWRLRVLGQADWERCPSARLIQKLREIELDMAAVEQQLRTVAMTQVVFAETLSAEAREVFGAESVRRALVEHASFLADLRRMVLSFTGRALRPIRGGGESSETRSGHLSVVPSPRSHVG
jgi:hypothetical protein